MRINVSAKLILIMLLILIVPPIAGGCARLPYTTTTIYDGPRVAVALQKEIDRANYTHPTELTAEEIASILRGFSLRREQRLPLRWFAQEESPKPVLRGDEVELVSSYLVDGLRKASPEERVHFQLFAPGMNRADTRSVTSGWIAVRDPYLYLGMEYFHDEVPIRHTDTYFMNYPLVPPMPGSYLLFFEPGRYWTTDDKGIRVLDYRSFLKSAPLAPPRERGSPQTPNAP